MHDSIEELIKFRIQQAQETISPPKHQQLIGWFNKEFVKTGKIDVNAGRIIHKAFEDRSDSDYGIFVEFEKEEVLQKLEDMKKFIKLVKNLI